MKEILIERKNKGNVTYRIVIYNDSEHIFIELEKLMKIRSKDPDKKTTKKVVYHRSFYKDNLEKVRDEIEDPVLLQFLNDTLLKV
ncbi:hypothetical protein [Erwinia persicina]|uniref:hypothetical protein n=1 Tax=Erwinia persicina TaxID=55211 RepID=UPI00188C0B19|nr:hypothetical protein [Erwinia persicina]